MEQSILFFFRDSWLVLNEISSGVWFAIWYSTIIGTALPYMLLSLSLKYTSSLIAAIYEPIQTLSGVLLAVIFLNEKLTVSIALGGIGIILGVLIVIWSKWKEKIEEEDKEGYISVPLEDK